MSVTRRSFLNSTPLVLAPAVWATVRPVAPAAPESSFPTQPAELAREMVGVSHNNLARVKELLARQPTLARAAYDWGFGDWEDALGAASHVGHREIAEVLLANGARPSIFSAAMLGHLETVKAFVTASPGVESTPGPHSITLLRHAMAGGARAQTVTDYLETLPAADSRPATQPLTPEQMAELVGEYVYGSGADERVTIAVSNNNALTFARTGRSARGLAHLGDRTFFPVGAPLVKIRFRSAASGMTLTVHDPDVVMEARKMTPGIIFQKT